MTTPNFEWYNDAVSMDALHHPSPRTGVGAGFFGAVLAALGILPFGWLKWIKAREKADLCNDSKYK